MIAEVIVAVGAIVSVAKLLNAAMAGFAVRLYFKRPALPQKLQLAMGSRGSRQWYQNTC